MLKKQTNEKAVGSDDQIRCTTTRSELQGKFVPIKFVVADLKITVWI